MLESQLYHTKQLVLITKSVRIFIFSDRQGFEPWNVFETLSRFKRDTLNRTRSPTLLKCPFGGGGKKIFVWNHPPKGGGNKSALEWNRTIALRFSVLHSTIELPRPTLNFGE